MAIVQTYNLNLVPESDPVIVNVSQYDKGEGRFIFNLYNGSSPYAPAAAAVGEVHGTKPDGKGFLYYVKDITGNAVTVDLNLQMSAVMGRTRSQILIHEPTGDTASFVFWLDVQESALPMDYDLSESDYALVEELIQEAQEAASMIAYGVEDAEAWAVGERDGQPVLPEDETYHNNSKYYAGQASDSASAADLSAEDAEAWAKGTRDGSAVTSEDPTYQNNSKYFSELSDSYSEDSEAYAKGTRDGVIVGNDDPAYHNNAKYWSDEAAASASAAGDEAENAEAWANGTKNGTNVPSTDPAYHNNAKYWSDESSDSATAASNSAISADGSAEDSEAYAIGSRDGVLVGNDDPAYHNNSKYYAQQAYTSAYNAGVSETNAGTSETNAGLSESAAARSEEDAEAWAVGERGGTPVGPSDPNYHNNAKYWSDQAQQAAQGSGHTIVDGAGVSMPKRGNLRFFNAKVEDDQQADSTNVTIESGSTVVITTTEVSLRGKTVTISDGSKTYTGTFDNAGTATISGVQSTGNLTVSSSDGTYTATGGLNIPYFGNYAVTIAFWAATVTVSTTTSQFNGLTVRAKKNGVTMASGVFSSGSATLTVPEAGTYTFETTLDWKTYVSSSESITQETTYSVTLNGFIATVNISTPTPEFYSGTVTVTSTGVPTSTVTLDASGDGSYTALQAGDYLFTLTYMGDDYTALVTVSAETTYSAVIKMWTATIDVSTTSPELDGQTVSLYAGGGTLLNTGTFSSGTVSFTVHETGTYTVSVTYDGMTYTDSVSVSAETTYSATLDTWNATLSISTTTPEFSSSTVTISKNGTTIGTVSLVSGSGSFVVHEAGTYTCTITYSGDDYTASVAVSAETTYAVTVNMWTAILSFSTTSAELYGATITVTDGNGATVGTAVFDNNGAADFRVHETGTYTGSVTYDGYTYTSSATVSAETTYNITLDTWNATITITTADFQSETITVAKDGTTIGTTAFSALGTATYTAHVTGLYTFTVSSGGSDYSVSVVVSAETSYSATLNMWAAVLSISTSMSALYGATITITDGNGVTVGTTTFSNAGTASYTVHAADTYTASCTHGGNTYTATAVVSSETTYNLTLGSIIYGFHIDGNESNPASAVSYQVQYNGTNVDNYSFTPAYMDYQQDAFNYGSWEDAFFMPRPCMLKYDGTVDYYLDPDDYTKKADGVTASDVANINYGGNAMMEWGRDGQKIWYKIVPDNTPTSYTVYISNAQMDNDFHCWSFYDSSDQIIDHFYTRIYEACVNNNKGRSISGVSNSKGGTPATMITYAKANNPSIDKGWNMDIFADKILINLLLILISKTLDSQTAFGKGNCQGGQYNLTPGNGNTKGLFYGTNTNNGYVKTFGMENLWGNGYERVLGFLEVEDVLQYKLTSGTADGSTQQGYTETEGLPTGYISSGITQTSQIGTYQKKYKAFSNGVILPIEFGGSASTYYCDGGYLALSGSGKSYFPAYGGDANNTTLCGMFSFSLDTWTRADVNFKFGLSCKPPKT